MTQALLLADTERETLARDVLRCTEPHLAALRSVLSHFNLTILQVDEHHTIPGSFWGDAEAGLISNIVYVRADTPVHSVLHEACHYICMDSQRRTQLHTDAGGDYDEENGVCYLQILLADYLPQVGRARLLADMDQWGYSFRLGNSQAWFEHDAADASAWLQQHHLIDADNKPTWLLRS